MKKILLSVILLTSLISRSALGCDCRATYKVPAGAGDVTISKIHASTVQQVFGGLYITLPYSVKWRGSQKIKAGKKHTFTFNVSSGCKGGTRQFAFTRKDKKTCYGFYNDPHNYDLCGIGSGSTLRKAPVISCTPDQWRTDSPR